MTADKILSLQLHTENVWFNCLKKVPTSKSSTIWGKTDGCEEKYKCSSALYIMWVLYQYHSIIIYQGISEPSHGKEVVDGINASENYFIYQLMYNGQLPGSKQFDSQILMYSCTQKNDVSLA